MKHLQVDLKNTLSFIDKNNFNNYDQLVKDQDEKLFNKTGKGSDFLGWVNLPNNISNDLISEINETAKQLREKYLI